ncbi:MAG: tetratricopeptide repeat protein [Deltaproteobacteria bacterium]|nr:tetratricopeptide repeat protein [Deltaproteobacteria bacterium]
MSNKDKILASAQKLLLKGRIDKAVKEYEQLIKLDPNEIRHRLKLAELYNRLGNTAKAIGEYEIIAKYYQNNRFHLKAIAVLKQLQKLQPERKELHRQLGELNEQQGLIGNAIAEYRNAWDYYEKDKKPEELQQVLKKIADLDPQNVPVRLKLVELFFRRGSLQDAQAEFDAVLEVVKGKKDAATLIPLYERYLSLFPDHCDTAVALAEVLIRSGQAEKGVATLEKLADRNLQNRHLLRTLAEGYEVTGKTAGRKKALAALLSLESENLKLWCDFIELCLASGDAKNALAALAPRKEKFLAADMGPVIRDFYRQLKEVFPENSRVQEGLKYLDEFFQKKENPFGSSALNEMGLPEVGSPSAPDIVSTAEESLIAAENRKDYGEIEIFSAQKGADDGGHASQVSSPAGGQTPADSFADRENEGEGFLDLDFSTDLGEEVANDPAPGDFSRELEECDFYLQQGLWEEAQGVCRNILAVRPDCPEALRRLEQIDLRRSSAAAAPRKKEEPPSALFSDAEDELDASLDLLLADSQKGIKTEIPQEDTETHFQLGIAFKEMGQLDEAIKEFDQAIKDPARFVASVVLKAGCLAEKGVLDAAEEYFLGMLAKSGMSAEDKMILNFELGLFYQQHNRLGEALARFQQVAQIDPSYRDAGEKVIELQNQLENGDSALAETASAR